MVRKVPGREGRRGRGEWKGEGEEERRGWGYGQRPGRGMGTGTKEEGSVVGERKRGARREMVFDVAYNRT